MKRLVVLAAVAALPALALAETTTWNIDPAHSDSAFAVKHLVISTVRGHFGSTTGTLHVDESDITRSSVEATIDVNTIDTRVPDRDKDLKSPSFFDAARYPNITFKSTKIEKSGSDRLRVTGDLTIKATTKPVTLDVTYTPVIKGPRGEDRRGFSATTKIDRKAFGLTYSKTIEAGPVIGDEVDIQIDAEAIKQGQQSRAAASTAAEKR
jgi:polyisoprenoid-binding protein YceI